MYLYSLLSNEAEWYPVLFDSPLNAVRSVAIWLTLALLITFAVCAFLFKKEKRAKFFKISLIFAVAYACVLGALYLLFTFQEDGVEAIVFIPLLLLLLSIATSAIVLPLKKTRAVCIAAGSAVAASFVATLVCMAIHFSSGKAAENNWLTNEDVNTIGLYISALLLVAAVILAALFFGRKEKRGFDSKTISYAGICIAISFSLSYLRLVRMPQGGSITPASVLPLMIFAYAFGVRKGVFVGFIYGLLQALQSTDGILHPAQFLLDFPVSYACVGFAGLFARNKRLKNPQLQITLGGIVAGLSRFVMHFISGIFAFGVFAPAGTPVALYSLTYQAGYVLPDLAIAIVVGIFVFSSKAFVKELNKLHKPLAKELKENQ